MLSLSCRMMPVAYSNEATGIIRQLREGNERLRAERDLLREKIV